MNQGKRKCNRSEAAHFSDQLIHGPPNSSDIAQGR